MQPKRFDSKMSEFCYEFLQVVLMASFDLLLSNLQLENLLYYLRDSRICFVSVCASFPDGNALS